LDGNKRELQNAVVEQSGEKSLMVFSFIFTLQSEILITHKKEKKEKIRGKATKCENDRETIKLSGNRKQPKWKLINY
jgi:hypothetical protein